MESTLSELTTPLAAPLLPKHRKQFAPFETSASPRTEESKGTITTHEAGRKASFVTSIFNLANNVAGAGLLTLAAGKASGGTGWIPSITICLMLACSSAWTFILIGRACEITGQKTFKGLWAAAYGEKTSYIVDTIIFCQCFLGSTIYIGLLGDIFSSALSKLSALPTFFSNRSSTIIGLSIVVLFPLNLIRNLSALGFTSILGLLAVSYTVLFMVYRYLDGSYRLHPPGKYIADGLITAPTFEGSSMWIFDLRSLILVSNLGLAFIAHYNGPAYWRELKDANHKNFKNMVCTAYAILAFLYAVTMCVGYATFGDICKGNILMNYHPEDTLATLGRLATGLSVLFGFPLVSNGAREGLKNIASAFGFTAVADPKHHVMLVICVLAAAAYVAIQVEDIKVIAGFSGAATGSFIVYICPTLIYTRIIRNQVGMDGIAYKNAKLNYLFVPFGLFVALMGVIVTYQSMSSDVR